ncbi:MAG: peptidylprolyl isomerase [Armatimonadetes bacterium]|nr:peptidylprolyl isomerase [Armatimonadota bacterium]
MSNLRLAACVSLLGGLVCLGGLFGVSGCGHRQDVAPAIDGQTPAGVPNDSGGYAKDLAEPPKEVATIAPEKLEQLIKEGHSTDSKDPSKRPDEEEEKKPESKPEEKPKPAEETKDSKTPDHSGDALWKSVKNPVVAMQTNKGVYYLELWPDVAPNHSKNMLKLVKAKFYDGILFHRVEPGFVVQAGDPQTKQLPLDSPEIWSGGPGWTVKAEFSDKPHLRGTLSMARKGNDINSGGSQFYVCLGAQSSLDGKYSVFGQVLGEGMDVVDKIQRGDIIRFAWVVHE